MRAWWLWLALAACGGERKDAAPEPAKVAPAALVPPPAPMPAPPVEPTPPESAVVELPPTPGLPSVIGGLRPYMLRTEAEAALRSLARATSWPPVLRINDSTRSRVYSVTPDAYIACAFRSDERLTSVTLYTTSTAKFPAAVRTRWGTGTNALRDDDVRRYHSDERWSATGWSVELKVGPGNNPYDQPQAAQFSELALEATDPTDAERPAVVDTSGPSFEAIAKLIGQPLDDATKLLGDELHVEAGERDRPQGFARVRPAWSDQRWELTLHTDENRVDRITLEGEASDDTHHLLVMRQLERAFGPRRAMIDELGDVVIGFGNGRVDARASKLDTSWTIDLRRR